MMYLYEIKRDCRCHNLAQTGNYDGFKSSLTLGFIEK